MAAKEVATTVERTVTKTEARLVRSRDELQQRHDDLYISFKELIAKRPKGDFGQEHIKDRTEIIHQITEVTIELCKVKYKLAELGRTALSQ